MMPLRAARTTAALRRGHHLVSGGGNATARAASSSASLSLAERIAIPASHHSPELILQKGQDAGPVISYDIAKAPVIPGRRQKSTIAKRQLEDAGRCLSMCPDAVPNAARRHWRKRGAQAPAEDPIAVQTVFSGGAVGADRL